MAQSVVIGYPDEMTAQRALNTAFRDSRETG
jgi:hypothetical protein